MHGEFEDDLEIMQTENLAYIHIHIRTRKIKVYHCSEIDRQKITDIIQIVHYKTTRKSILLNWMFHNGAPSSILEFGVLFGRSTFSIKSIRYKS